MQLNSQFARQILESKLAEVTNLADWRDSIAVHISADPIDTTQHLGEREIACHGLSRNASLVREVRAGLKRLTEGAYGVCVDCDEPISPKRLAAVPWAPRCIACQNHVEAAGVQNERLAA
jgi:DnaK suppressor protein